VHDLIIRDNDFSGTRITVPAGSGVVLENNINVASTNFDEATNPAIDRSHRIQQSSTLAPDSWTDVETVTGDGDPVSRTLPMPAERAFYRVVVE